MEVQAWALWLNQPLSADFSENSSELSDFRSHCHFLEQAWAHSKEHVAGLSVALQNNQWEQLTA
jgi:hypothetical protein